MVQFQTLEAYLSSRQDVAFWRPFLEQIIALHDLRCDIDAAYAGTRGTHPTFVVQDVVIKLFGHASFWRQSHRAELSAMRFVSTISEVSAPRLIAHGALFESDDESSWPYIVTTRVSGKAWSEEEHTRDELECVADELGRQLRLLHDLVPMGLEGYSQWNAPSVLDALKNSAFPVHLRAQIPEYLANLPPTRQVFVHGDLVSNHILISGGQLSAIIDWGDALIASPYYDIGKLFFHTFHGDRALFARFLSAYKWPEDEHFASQTLGWALRRQSVGLAQHHGFDVFNHLPSLVSLPSVATLDDLAEELFSFRLI